MKRLGAILLIIVFILMVKNDKVQAQAQAESTTQDLKLRHNIEYKAGDLKDPFLPPKIEEEEVVEGQKQAAKEEVSAIPLPKLTIQGVVWGSVLPQAIINSKVVKIGDTIEEALIIDINKDGVTLSFNNQEYSLGSPALVNPEDLKKLGGVDYGK